MAHSNIWQSVRTRRPSVLVGSQAWDVTRTADQEKSIYSGMKHETTDVLHNRMAVEHNRQTVLRHQRPKTSPCRSPKSP